MRQCAYCGKPCPNSGDEHHMIPIFFQDYTNVNLDQFRIVLCSKHHIKITEAWEQIRRKLL